METGVFVGIAYSFYALLLYKVISPYWQILKRETRRGGGRIQFTIGDCWAAAIGLSPTSWLAAQAMEHENFERHPGASLAMVLSVALFWGMNQLAGILIVLATNVAPTRKIRNDFYSALWIVGGGFFGLFLPLIGVLMIPLADRDSAALRDNARRRFKRRKATALKKRAVACRSSAGGLHRVQAELAE
jgi:hypothetical protein